MFFNYFSAPRYCKRSLISISLGILRKNDIFVYSTVQYSKVQYIVFCSLPTELEPHCDFNDCARSSMVLTEQGEELEIARQDVKDRAKDRAMEAMEGR